jgi:tetratricopeptide (TPR) repeat protein
MRLAVPPLARLCSFVVLLGAYLSGGSSETPSRSNVDPQQIWEQAQTAQRQQHFKEAIRLYQQFLTLEPSLLEAELNLGLMYQVTNDFPSAISQFKKVLEAKPGNYPANLFAGLDYLKLGKPEMALPLLQKAVEEQPAEEKALVGLANSNLQLQHYDVARSEFQQAVSTDKKNADAWYGLGVAYLSLEKEAEIALAKSTNAFRTILRAQSNLQQDNPKAAIEALDSVPVKSANVPCSRALLGFAYLANGQVDEAGKTLRADWNDSSKTGCLLGKLGLASLDAYTHDETGALGQIREAAAIDAPAVAAAGDLFRAYFDHSEQAARVREIIESSPRPAPPNAPPEVLKDTGRYTACTQTLANNHQRLTISQKLVLSECAFFAGQNAVVLDTTSEILESNPRNEPALFWRVQALDRLSLESLGTATAINPDSVSLHMMYASMQRSQLRFADAEEEYQKAIALNQAYLPAHLGLAYCLYFQKKLEEAQHEVEVVLQQEKTDGEANLLMGQILIRRDQSDRAVPYLKAALSGDSNRRSEVHSELSRVYEGSGNINEAIAELQKAVPGDSDGSFYYRLARLLQKTGRRTEASQAFAESKRLRSQSGFSSAGSEE